MNTIRRWGAWLLWGLVPSASALADEPQDPKRVLAAAKPRPLQPRRDRLEATGGGNGLDKALVELPTIRAHSGRRPKGESSRRSTQRQGGDDPAGCAKWRDRTPAPQGQTGTPHGDAVAGPGIREAAFPPVDGPRLRSAGEAPPDDRGPDRAR